MVLYQDHFVPGDVLQGRAVRKAHHSPQLMVDLLGVHVSALLSAAIDGMLSAEALMDGLR